MRKQRIRLLFVAALCATSLQGSTASQLYKKGLKAERSGAIAQAYIDYSEAAAADPKKSIYRERAAALAPMAAAQANVTPPANASAPAPNVAPPVESVFDSITARELAENRQLEPPALLDLSETRLDLDIEGNYKSLFESLAKRLGLQVIFDGDYHPGSPTRFRLNDVSPRDALHALEAVTHSIVIPLSSKLVMVAQDTDAKRKDLEQMATVSVPVSSVLTTQELVELGQAIKQTVGVDRMYWDSQANQIVLRDRVSRVLAAQSVLQDLTASRGEVALELEFFEVDDSQLMDIGVDVELSFPITFIGSVFQGTATAASTIQVLRTVALGRLYSVALPNVNVIALLNKTGARTMLKANIVSMEGQAAQFHAGERYPILTSSYIGNVTPGSQVYTPPPSFNFEDLGLSIKATPRIHGTDEVSLDLESEFKVLGATQSNGIPIISDRKIHSMVRMKDNQWALIVGLTGDSTSRTWSGPPWLYHVPFLGNLVTRFTKQRNRNWIVLAIRPTLIGLPPDQIVTHEVPVGSQTKTITPL